MSFNFGSFHIFDASGFFNYLSVVLFSTISNRQKKAGNPGLLLGAFSGQRGVMIAGSQCILPTFPEKFKNFHKKFCKIEWKNGWLVACETIPPPRVVFLEMNMPGDQHQAEPLRLRSRAGGRAEPAVRPVQR